MCQHVTSGQLKLDREHKCLILEIVCDLCHRVLDSKEGEAYTPHPNIGSVAQSGRALG